MNQVPTKFSKEDDAYIRAAWVKNTPAEEIASALGRSVGSIRNRVFQRHHDLMKGGSNRDSSVVALASIYGTDDANRIVASAGSACAARAAIVEAEKQAQAMMRDAQVARKRMLIEGMLARIKRGDSREAAIFETYMAGVTMIEIGKALGVSRERARQLCKREAFSRALAALTGAP